MQLTFLMKEIQIQIQIHAQVSVMVIRNIYHNYTYIIKGIFQLSLFIHRNRFGEI